MSAGSAGHFFSRSLPSVAMIPTGIPPRRALPVTTASAQPDKVSVKDPDRAKEEKDHGGWNVRSV